MPRGIFPRRNDFPAKLSAAKKRFYESPEARKRASDAVLAWSVRTFPDRLMARVQKTDTCWLWTDRLVAGGYGQVRLPGGRLQQAHRAVYELLVGPIPEGLTLDHLCRVRHCVRPDHMHPCTRAENVRRGVLWRAAEKGLTLYALGR